MDVGEWLNGWMVGWLNGRMVGWLNGRMVGWLNGRMVEWSNGWNLINHETTPKSQIGSIRRLAVFSNSLLIN